MAAVKDLADMLSQMRPALRDGGYVFVSCPDGLPPGLSPVMTFAEQEGMTAILAQQEADKADLSYDLVTAWITLQVNSALDGVGLTAAVSGVLADAGISCNVVAAAHHDHLFVPAESAATAVRLLEDLSRRFGR